MGNNGYFGNIVITNNSDTPKDIFTLIQNQCKYTIDYISKIGFYCFTQPGNIDSAEADKIYITIGQKDVSPQQFQIGEEGLLEYQDVKITSISVGNISNNILYIDYQYEKQV